MTAAEQHFRKVAPPYMRKLMEDFPVGEKGAAAVFGNAGHESAGFTKLQEINPTVPGSAGGWGWFQWTGPRRRAFEAYCKRHGYDKASHEANYKWLFLELKGPERGAIPRMMAAGDNLASMTKAFELAFERAGVKHYPSRYKWAEIALDAFRVGGVDTPLPPDSPTPEVSGWDRFWAWFKSLFD